MLGTLAYLGGEPGDYQIPGFHMNPMYELKVGDEATSHADLIPLAGALAFDDDADLPASLAGLCDLPAWYALFAVESALSNYDSPVGDANNHCLYVDGDGVAHVLPWDLNESFGGWNCFVDDATAIYERDPFDPVCPDFVLPLVERTAATPPLRAAYADMLGTLRTGALATDAILAEVDRVHDLVAAAYAADANAFWDAADFEAAYDGPVGGFGGPTPGLRPFVTERLALVDAWLAKE